MFAHGHPGLPADSLHDMFASSPPPRWSGIECRLSGDPVDVV
jgi:hypothetical protein